MERKLHEHQKMELSKRTGMESLVERCHEGRKEESKGSTQEFIWLLTIVQHNEGWLQGETLEAHDPESC